MDYTFDEYIKRVYEQLECNMSDTDKSQYVCFGYSEQEINEHIDYFETCFNKGMSPYKALTFLTYEKHIDY